MKLSFVCEDGTGQSHLADWLSVLVQGQLDKNLWSCISRLKRDTTERENMKHKNKCKNPNCM